MRRRGSYRLGIRGPTGTAVIDPLVAARRTSLLSGRPVRLDAPPLTPALSPEYEGEGVRCSTFAEALRSERKRHPPVEEVPRVVVAEVVAAREEHAVAEGE